MKRLFPCGAISNSIGNWGKHTWQVAFVEDASAATKDAKDTVGAVVVVETPADGLVDTAATDPLTRETARPVATSFASISL